MLLLGCVHFADDRQARGHPVPQRKAPRQAQSPALRSRWSPVLDAACRVLQCVRDQDAAVLSQLVEVKLQLARTIDLGLELPNSDKPLASVNGAVAVRDCRYAIFYGDRDGSTFTITALVVVTGEDFLPSSASSLAESPTRNSNSVCLLLGSPSRGRWR